MKTRSCTLNFDNISIDELNKSLSFYYGKDAFISQDGKTLHFKNDVEDQDLIQIAEMSKSTADESKILDSHNEKYQRCCQWHDFNNTDFFLDHGALIFSKETISIINKIKEIYFSMAQSFFNAEHLAVPNTIDIKHLKTAGYFKKFPAQAMLVSTLPLNPNEVHSISGLDQSNSNGLKNHYNDKSYALNPVTCYHIYGNFKELYNKTNQLTYSIEGKAHRYEGRNTENSRLIEFNMAEIVFMETDDTKVSIDSLIDFYKSFFSILELPVKFIVSSDAFFTIDASIHAKLQERTTSKIEIVCMEKNSSLVVGSINTHFDFFVKRFHLDQDSPIKTSKCTGIGIERLFLALSSYHPEKINHILNNALLRVNNEPKTDII